MPAKKKVSKKSESINIGRTVRLLREKFGLSGAELCRRSGSLDTKTLTALEKGRIVNPSIQTLEALSKGFGITVSEIFRHAELGSENHFYLGSQKGAFELHFPKQGLDVISFTPLQKDFFCGKILFQSKKKFDQSLFEHHAPFFIMVLMGRFSVKIEDHEFEIREGENVFFDGGSTFQIKNELYKKSVLLVVSVPSFMSSH